MARKNKKPDKVRIVLVVLLVVILLSGWAVFRLYERRWAPNVTTSFKLFIPTGAGFDQVMDSIRPFLSNANDFVWLAEQKKYTGHVRPGRYTISKGENNEAVINRLRIGKQDEISIRIGNYASIYELAGKVAPYLEPDSSQIVMAIKAAGFAEGYDSAALIYFYRPDTYNFFWNTSGEQFVSKMKKQFDLFWTPERTALADRQGLTPLKATTLASIVQLESSKVDEQPMVAGLYLNRLKVGMKLDADPTVVFALQQQEGFTRKVRRVYFKDLAISSPYNTYRNKGLPPGPICMPNDSAIDAVLAPAKHDYFYFVADPARPGYHIFARTLQEHVANASVYRSWADSNQIK